MFTKQRFIFTVTFTGAEAVGNKHGCCGSFYYCVHMFGITKRLFLWFLRRMTEGSPSHSLANLVHSIHAHQKCIATTFRTDIKYNKAYKSVSTISILRLNKECG